MFNINAGSSGQSEPDRESWKKSHRLFTQAFREPKTASEVKKLAKILKKPLLEEVEMNIFDYDTGFLRGLGRMSLSAFYKLNIRVTFFLNSLQSSRHTGASTRSIHIRIARAFLTFLSVTWINAQHSLVSPSLPKMTFR